jgi:hypothetical protein
MREQLEEMRLNGTLSMEQLDRIAPPKQLYDQYSGAALKLDQARATPKYKELNKILEGRIVGAIKEVKKIAYKDVGAQSDQFNWFVGTQIRKNKKKILDLVATGTPMEDAIDKIGNSAAIEAKAYLLRPDVFDGVTFKPYEAVMDASTKAQLVAQRRVTAFKRFKTREEQNDPSNWLSAIGEPLLVEASKRLAEKGTSEVLNVIGQRTGMTAYEVQHKLSEVSENIEPIEINKTYEQIQNAWSAEQRYAFTSNQASDEQRLRTLQQQTNQLENRNSYRTRESFQTSQATVPLEGTVQEKANQAITYMKQEMGMSDFHAYGLIANAIRESSLLTTNPGDKGTSDGWFQWHAGRLSRAKEALGDQWNNWQAQIQYAIKEEGEPGQEYLQQNFSSRQEAADWWMKYWERPAHPERDSRRHSEILGNF